MECAETAADRQPTDDLVRVNVPLPPNVELLEAIADLHLNVLSDADSYHGKGVIDPSDAGVLHQAG